jgi:phage terminase large subunit-like protein
VPLARGAAGYSDREGARLMRHVPAEVYARPPTSLEFFAMLNWIDGRPLLETIEPYRQRIFADVLDGKDAEGRPLYNMALCGRAKKNWKTADLILSSLYKFLAVPSPAGNDCFILANDEAQAADDLSLAKKLIRANPLLDAELVIQAKEIIRRDGCGALRILPSRDAVGQHGKTFAFVGFDEIHGYRTHDLFEALAQDPTRHDALTWITSYNSLRNAPGVPLADFLAAGKRGDDPRMFFSWYAGDYTTDPTVPEDATPEQRANPSLASWGDDGYLAQQKRRLPTHRYRRLHLNMPGAPDGAAFNADNVISAIVAGRKRLDPEEGRAYRAFVDMSGGSLDDAALGVSHYDPESQRTILDSVMSQAGGTPFNPRDAVRKFVSELGRYGLSKVTGDAYAGQTFRRDFEDAGIVYEVSRRTKAEIYDEFEPRLNAGEIELLDMPKLTEQLLTLVIRGNKIDHQPGDHDDWANAACGACVLAGRYQQTLTFHVPTTGPSLSAIIAQTGGGVGLPSAAAPGGWPAGSQGAAASGPFANLNWTGK